jgi:hypothetical protein
VASLVLDAVVEAVCGPSVEFAKLIEICFELGRVADWGPNSGMVIERRRGAETIGRALVSSDVTGGRSVVRTAAKDMKTRSR